MEQTPKASAQVRRVGRPPKVQEDMRHPIPPEESFAAACNAAQAYALRIWSGQSADLPRAERLARVAAGLAGQGMSMDGVEL